MSSSDSDESIDYPLRYKRRKRKHSERSDDVSSSTNIDTSFSGKDVGKNGCGIRDNFTASVEAERVRKLNGVSSSVIRVKKQDCENWKHTINISPCKVRVFQRQAEVPAPVVENNTCNLLDVKPKVISLKRSHSLTIEERAARFGLEYHDTTESDSKECDTTQAPLLNGVNIAGRTSPIKTEELDLLVVPVEDIVQEFLDIKQNPLVWMTLNDDSILNPTIVNSWRTIGPRDQLEDFETIFAAPRTLERLRDAKTIVSLIGRTDDMLDEQLVQTMANARANLSPYYNIPQAFFVHRSAVILANIDADMDFCLTQPLTEENSSSVDHREVFTYLDINSQSNGCSDYVLWRRNWETRVFSVPNKNSAPTLDNYPHGPGRMEVACDPYGDSNILVPHVLTSIMKSIWRVTNPGVHVVTAFAGVDMLELRQDVTKVILKHMYVSEIVLALSVLRTGGHFIIKFQQLLTPFEVGLVFLLHKSFRRIAIHKPATSLPGSFECYVLCKWKRTDISTVYNYLCEIHDMYGKWRARDAFGSLDIQQIVAIDELKRSPFFDFIYAANNRMAMQQLKLLKFSVSCTDTFRFSRTEEQIQFAKFIQVPSLFANVPKERPAVVQDFMKYNGMLHEPETSLTIDSLKKHITSSYDWRFLICGTFQCSRGYYYCHSSRVFRWMNLKWIKVDVSFELLQDTLVYGEFVHEYLSDDFNLGAKIVFHLIDALVVEGVDIQNLHYTERLICCSKLAYLAQKAFIIDAELITKNGDGVRVRVKEAVRLENICELFKNLVRREIGGENKVVCPVTLGNELVLTLPAFEAHGVLFLNHTNEPWTMAKSKKSGQKYWFNTQSNESTYTIPEAAISTFSGTMGRRLFWSWNKKTQLNYSDCFSATDQVDQVHAKIIYEHIEAVS